MPARRDAALPSPTRASRVRRLRRRVGRFADRGGRARYAHRSPPLRSGSLPTARKVAPACGGHSFSLQLAPPLDPSASCQMLGAASHQRPRRSRLAHDNYGPIAHHFPNRCPHVFPCRKRPRCALTCPALPQRPGIFLPASSRIPAVPARQRLFAKRRSCRTRLQRGLDSPACGGFTPFGQAVISWPHGTPAIR